MGRWQPPAQTTQDRDALAEALPRALAARYLKAMRDSEDAVARAKADADASLQTAQDAWQSERKRMQDDISDLTWRTEKATREEARIRHEAIDMRTALDAAVAYIDSLDNERMLSLVWEDNYERGLTDQPVPPKEQFIAIKAQRERLRETFEEQMDLIEEASTHVY